jgi:hypothetical protein
MPSDGGDSRSLLFPQQGQVDWVNLGRNSVEFTVQSLSRLSSAGIEALTIYAARAVFHQVKLDLLGEQRVISAVQATQAFPSYNDALWFGFGIKHVVRSLSESQQGVACIGLCACMTEEFSASVSARVLKELLELYGPPAELSPSLRQWLALVESCEGVVAKTNFGIILSELSRICLLNGQSNLRTGSAPKNIAKVLRGLFDVSQGVVEQINIAGGADCAWLAAVAHWLLGLRVVVEDQLGNVVYRPGNLKSTMAQEPQVIIRFGTADSETSALTQKSYVVPNGRILLVEEMDNPEDDILAHGRLNWSTCLCDTFGKQMQALLNTFASHAGACLGSAARIYEHLTCNEEQTLLEEETYDLAELIPNPASFGKGFVVHARNIFPELRDAPGLLRAMELSRERSAEAAIREFTECITSIRAQCNCFLCKEDSPDITKPPSTGGQYCMVGLVYTICALIRLSARIIFQKDHPTRPAMTGIERIYHCARIKIFHNIDYVSKLAMSQDLSMADLQLVHLLFTGRYGSNLKGQRLVNTSAVAASGLCIYSNALCELSTEPERACLVHVVPGRIQWKGYLYGQVDDAPRDAPCVQGESKWFSTGVSAINSYDNLNDSSSSDLHAALVIEEWSPSRQTIVAEWRISNSKGSWYFGPLEINSRLIGAYCGKTCEPNSCDSLNGFKCVLIQGEGLIQSEQIAEDDCSANYGPIIRMLSGNPAAILVALTQIEVPSSSGRDITLRQTIQGKQCIRCCVISSIRRFKTQSSRYPLARACIITSV